MGARAIPVDLVTVPRDVAAKAYGEEFPGVGERRLRSMGGSVSSGRCVWVPPPPGSFGAPVPMYNGG